MRRTRKWTFVAQEANRLAKLGLKPSQIAKKLRVDKSTVTRWMKAGKIARRANRRVTQSRPPAAAVAVNEKKPAEWAAAVRAEYDLDATDDQLVTLAESALLLSKDPRISAPVRMNAAGRFQALVKQLALVTKATEKDQPSPVETPVKEAPARPALTQRHGGADPRAILMAVK